MGDITTDSAQVQTIFRERPVPEFAAGYGTKVAAHAKKRTVVFEVHDLMRAIGRGEKCFPDFEFGPRNQEILEAIDQSSRSGAWVSTARLNKEKKKNLHRRWQRCGIRRVNV
jgi:predicted dehydrogenase